MSEVADPLEWVSEEAKGPLTAVQYQGPSEELARLRAEDQLHRAFLTSILEHHDYTYDEVTPEIVLRGIEQREKAPDAQLAVSVHTLETRERVSSTTPTGSAGRG